MVHKRVYAWSKARILRMIDKFAALGLLLLAGLLIWSPFSLYGKDWLIRTRLSYYPNHNFPWFFWAGVRTANFLWEIFCVSLMVYVAIRLLRKRGNDGSDETPPAS